MNRIKPPTVTKNRAALIKQMMPSEEARPVFVAYRDIIASWQQMVDTDELDPNYPDRSEELDVAIKKALVKLSGESIKDSLGKLAWMALCLYDPSMSKDWTGSAKDRLCAAILIRLRDTDFYLAQHRALKGRIGHGWLVAVAKRDGGVANVERTFPMYGIEIKMGLDSLARTKAFYREQLIERRLIR